MMVDTVGQHPPKLERDIYWDIGIPDELPYTVASLPFRTPPAQTSAEELHVPIREQQPIYPQYLEPNEKQVSRRNSLKMAVSSVFQWAATPILKRRSSKTLSLKSMEDGKSGKVNCSRQLASCTSSPKLQSRKFVAKSRSASIDFSNGLPGNFNASTPTEARSRKTSTKSNKSSLLSPVYEGNY